MGEGGPDVQRLGVAIADNIFSSRIGFPGQLFRQVYILFLTHPNLLVPKGARAIILTKGFWT